MRTTDLKYLALYLPQFHRIHENDEWWGEGFTEWTNVKAAQSYFDGHYQPHVPHEDIGYYDLKDGLFMEKQAAMAKQYGIHGFCYYYYWFNGRTLLDTPLKRMLDNPRVDIPFCLFWANHNWTRSWDAGNTEILLEQVYNPEVYTRFIDDLAPYFNDKRYIKINGRPVLVVYQPDHLDDPKGAVDVFRRHAREQHGTELYLIHCQQNNTISPVAYGYDAAMEGAPNYRAKTSLLPPEQQPVLQDGVDVTFYDYLTNAFQHILRKEKYKLFKCVYPMWDNTPRRKEKKGWMFLGAAPELFKNYLIEISKYTLSNFPPKERFIFINAWNEWAEGTHLEPDEKYGYQHLEICKKVSGMPKSKLMKSGFDPPLYHAYRKKIIMLDGKRFFLFGLFPIPFVRTLRYHQRKKIKFLGLVLLKIK
jgi:hypothetical protein